MQRNYSLTTLDLIDAHDSRNMPHLTGKNTGEREMLLAGIVELHLAFANGELQIMDYIWFLNRWIEDANRTRKSSWNKELNGFGRALDHADEEYRYTDMTQEQMTRHMLWLVPQSMVYLNYQV